MSGSSCFSTYNRKHFSKTALLLTLCILLLFTSGCREGAVGVDSGSTNKSWQSGTLSDSSIKQIKNRAEELEYLNVLLVHRNGKLKLEHYNDLAPGQPVNLKSASKSVLSALVGLALEGGHLESLDQRLIEFFPELLAGAPGGKQSITLRDLLVMRSGLETTSFHNYGDWVTSSNWLADALNQPLESTPGTKTRYSTGNSHIVAAVLSEATGQDLQVYAQQRLFDPLGVKIHHWQRSPEGYRFGGNNLSLSPEAMLRFGRLYLNAGRFNGRRILPADWVERSTRPRVEDTHHGYPYGFYWWNTEYYNRQVLFAWGHGGQYIFIVPELELVVVTATNRQSSNKRNGITDRIHELVEGIVGESVRKVKK